MRRWTRRGYMTPLASDVPPADVPGKNSAPPPRRWRRDRAAVLLGDLADDREAEAGARPAAGVGAAVEAVEDVRQVGGVDAAAVVAHPHAPRAGTRPPRSGLWRAALSSRLLTARASRSGTPSTTAGSSSRVNATSGAWRCARSIASATSASSRTSSGTGLGWSPRASSIRSATSAPSSSAWACTSAITRARSAGSDRLGEHLDVRAQRRHRRAQLVRGVGDELALGGDRALQRVEHRVEARGQLADLVLARDLDPAAEVLGLRDVARRLGHAHHRGHEAARGEPPERARPARCRRGRARAGPSAAGRAPRRSTPASGRAGSRRRRAAAP